LFQENSLLGFLDTVKWAIQESQKGLPHWISNFVPVLLTTKDDDWAGLGLPQASPTPPSRLAGGLGQVRNSQIDSRTKPIWSAGCPQTARGLQQKDYLTQKPVLFLYICYSSCKGVMQDKIMHV
jgi:hypothetical protein